MTARRTIRLGIAFGASLVGFVSDRAACASEGDSIVQLEYSVAGGCPDEAAFTAGVRARAPRFATGGAVSTPSWRITARRDADSESAFTGRISMRDTEGRATARDVSGATCREVIAALELIGALTIDAKATVTDAPPESAPPLPPPTVPAPAPAPMPMPTAAEEPRRWQLGIAGRADLHAGIAPSAVVALGGLVELRARHPGWWSPSMRVGFARTFESSAALTTGGSAVFVLTMGTLDLCPSRADLGRFSVAGCLRGELGELWGQGRNINPPREQPPLWAAVDGLARGEVALVGPFSFAITAGLRIPIVRTRFFFQPDATVFRPAAVGSLAGLELVVRLL